MSLAPFTINTTVPRPNQRWTSALFGPYGDLSPIGRRFFAACPPAPPLPNRNWDGGPQILATSTTTQRVKTTPGALPAHATVAAQMEGAQQPQPVVVAAAMAAAGYVIPLEEQQSAAAEEGLGSRGRDTAWTGSRRAHGAKASGGGALAEEEAGEEEEEAAAPPLPALVIAEPDRFGPERQLLLRTYGLSEPEAMPPVHTNDTCVGLRDYADFAKETGIFRAHRAAWQRVAQSGRTTLVMESDWSFGNMPPANVRIDLRREFESTVGLNFIGYCWLVVDDEKPTVWSAEERRSRLDRWLSHASSATSAAFDTSKLCADEGGDCDVLPTCATAYVISPQMASQLAAADPCEGDAHQQRSPLDVFMFEQCWEGGGDASTRCRWLDGRPYDKWHPWPHENRQDLFSEDAKYFGWGLVVQDRAAFEGLHSNKNRGERGGGKRSGSEQRKRAKARGAAAAATTPTGTAE